MFVGDKSQVRIELSLDPEYNLLDMVESARQWTVLVCPVIILSQFVPGRDTSHARIELSIDPEYNI